MERTFEPKVLAFLCNWCSYAGADLAGVSRYQYPPTVRVLRTMCSGRVDPLHIIEGFKSGFDGVLVFGCHPGDCHYLEGNYYALIRVEVVRQLLDLSGIGAERLQIRWVSAAEGQIFANAVTELSQVIANSGPFVLDRFQSQLSVLESVLNSPRLRWLIGMDRQLTQRENVFHKKITEEKFRQLLEGIVQVEYQKALIMGALEKGPLSVREMAEATGLPVYTISLRLGDLERIGVADFYAFEGTTPRFLKVAV